jgi:hypothetical protein
VVARAIDRDRRAVGIARAGDEPELELEVEVAARPERRTGRIRCHRLPARAPYRRAAHDDVRRTAMIADRDVAIILQERRAGPKDRARIRRMLDRRIEVDVILDVDRKRHRDVGATNERGLDQRTLSMCDGRTDEMLQTRAKLRPTLASGREECVQRRRAIERRLVDEPGR